MARIQDTDDDTRGRRGKAMRYAVPVAAAGIAAATIGLVPALASAGTPDLPKISAQKLIEKIAASDTQTISGSVKITTDFGLPALANLDTSAFGDLTGGASGGSGDSGSAADPTKQLTQLLTGTHILHVAADGPDRQKVSIVEQAAEYSVIHNGTQLWAYDSGSNQAYHTILPKDAADRPVPAPSLSSLTPQEAAEQALKAVDDTTSVTVDGTARVAGRDAYQLLIKPKSADTTVGAIRIAVDSDTGVPLKFTLTPKGSAKAAVDVGFTKVDFAKPSASTFTFTPPKGTKVTTEKADADAAKPDHTNAAETKNAEDALSGLDAVGLGKGWDSIAELKLPAGESAGASGASGDLSLLNSFGKQVNGDFGSGTFVSTRVINALITDSGKVYIGAVSQDALIKAANK
jgi:outer membrane lipoprotein-sorting protein